MKGTISINNYYLMQIENIANNILCERWQSIPKEQMSWYLMGAWLTNQETREASVQVIDSRIEQWRSSHFIPQYPIAVQDGTLSEDELDCLFEEDKYLINECNMRAMEADELYKQIQSLGFYDDEHELAVSTAYAFGDSIFLMSIWEDMYLDEAIYMRDTIELINNRLQTTISQPKKFPEDYPQIFDIKTCSEAIEYSVHSIYKLVSNRAIPYYKPGIKGRKLMFDREEIFEWMQSRKVTTIDEFLTGKDMEMALRANSNRAGMGNKSINNKK